MAEESGIAVVAGMHPKHEGTEAGTSMADAQTGSILIRVVDGARAPLSDDVKWSATIHDGRSPDEWKPVTLNGSGSGELIKGLQWFDNNFDNYTVIITASGYDDVGWVPVHISPKTSATVNLMLIKKDAQLSFEGADWGAINSLRPRFAGILSTGISNAADRYAGLIKGNGGLSLASILNLLTAMSQITLPSDKSPLDYYWQPIWDDNQFPMAQDRFFAYVDKALVDDVVKAAKMGAFAEEKDPGAFHPGATLSYKQTQFDVTNVQLTFHQGNTKQMQGPDGPVDCIIIEPDIDYYKDLLSHFFEEVIPNKVTEGLTDPRVVYLLRWMAARQIGSDFNPLYTMTV